MRIAGRGSAWPAVGLALSAVLISSGVPAQAPQPRAPAQLQIGAPNTSPAQPEPAAPPSADVAPPQNAPGSAPGFIDAFTRWMQESTAGFNAGTWGNTKGMSDAASSAARTTTDVAKGAAEATRGAADVVTGVARDTAGALSRLPAARVAAGRERCTVAPNGAPDCRVAAETLCRQKGFSSGSSIDFETAEVCPSSAALARWRGEPATCGTENYVTRALCQ
jgi:hypothetical protein